MAAFDLMEAMQVLRATPVTMRALLGGVSSPWLHARAGEGTWSPVEILGHLIAGDETDWIPRVRIMLEHGISQPFEPFDREQQFAPSTRSIPQLLDRFETYRRANLKTLESFRLNDASLESRGVHSEFGEVRLGDMLAAWVVHDLSHVAQAVEVMAKRYIEDVGPWRRYLPLLDREEVPSE